MDNHLPTPPRNNKHHQKYRNHDKYNANGKSRVRRKSEIEKAVEEFDNYDKEVFDENGRVVELRRTTYEFKYQKYNRNRGHIDIHLLKTGSVLD